MNSRTISVLVRCWYDPQTNAMQLQLIRTDTLEEVRLGDKGFLLRISVDEEKRARCYIRHIASGREAYVQGGARLVAFINDCLLNGGDPGHNDQGGTET